MTRLITAPMDPISFQALVRAYPPVLLAKRGVRRMGGRFYRTSLSNVICTSDRKADESLFQRGSYCEADRRR